MTPRNRAALALALLAISAAALLRFGPHVLDDTYITLRYVRNLLGGRGLAYNPGEYLQGFTSPLHVAALSLVGAAGVPLPAAAVALSILAGLAALALVVAAGKQAGDELAGWLAAAALATDYIWVVMWGSGLETTFAAAVSLALLMATIEGQWRWTGSLAGIALLTRIDTAAVCGLAWLVVLWKGGWRIAMREGAIASVICAPWMAFAWWYFGAPIPHTIAAKSVLHAGFPFHEVFSQFRLWLGLHTAPWAILALAAAGAAVLVRQRREWALLPVWCGALAAAFLAKRTPLAYYPWYLVPALPAAMLLAAVGLAEGIRRIARGRNAVQAGACAAAVFALCWGLARRTAEHDAFVVPREGQYRDAALALAPLLEPGDAVLAGEIGAFAWHLPAARIVDSAGIATPGVTEAWRRDQQAGIPAEGWRPSDDAIIALMEEYRVRFALAREIHIPLRHLAQTRLAGRFRIVPLSPELEASGLTLLQRVE